MALFGRRSPRDRFAGDVAAAARRELKATVTVRKDFTLAITTPGGGELVLFLDNLWAESRNAGVAERESRIRTAVLAMNVPARPASWDQAGAAVLPALRNTSWINAAAGRPPVGRPCLPFLVAATALDSEHAMTYVSAPDLATWGVTEEEVEERARRNLAARAVPYERDGAGYVVTGPDGYASSWLACPERLVQLADDLAPPVLMLATSRDDVRLISATDVGLLDELRAAIEAYERHPRRLSPVPYVIDGAAVAMWQPPAGSAAAPAVDRAAAVLALYEYTDQQNRLHAQYAADGTDVYVASFTLQEGPGDTVWSWCTWAKGVSASLLPRTTLVGLTPRDSPRSSGPEDATFLVRWDDLLRLAPTSLVPAPELDPPRWRHGDFPGDAVVHELRAVAVTPPGASGRAAR